MGAAGYLVSCEPGSRGHSLRRQPGSFCYPEAGSDAQNRRTWSCSLALSPGAGLEEPRGRADGGCRAGFPEAVPRQPWESHAGRRSPAVCGSCSPPGAHGGGAGSTRCKPNKKQKEIGTGLPARDARQPGSALHPLFWWKGWGAWKGGGCRRGQLPTFQL